MKALPGIAGKLKEAMGLDIESVGNSLVERVVRERMAALSIPDDEMYLAELHASPEEMQQLVELAVVPETWFFRDREAMLAIARKARDRLLEKPAEKIRILSLPCSTGEEPYSVVMALFDEGVPASAFQIDAIDIRTRSLETAAQGLYGRNSFRGRDLSFRARYFTEHGNEWLLAEEVRAPVVFQPGNMLAPDFMSHEPRYDFILCRNVLIYFDRPLQKKAAELLERLLKEDGLVFVGPAEGGILLSPRVAPAGIPLAFGFRKREEHQASLPAADSGVRARSPVMAWRPAPAKVEPVLPPPVIAPVIAPVLAAPVQAQAATRSLQSLLDEARKLADRGELDRADALCEQAIDAHGASAGAFYLKGLICDAGGDAASAMRCYRKAVYLKPDHHEALLHLAELLQAQGDAAGAGLMRQRAQRAVSKPEGRAHV